MHRFLKLILVGALAVAGCNGPFTVRPSTPPPIEDSRFVMITPTAQETLASLAQTWLGDEEKAWQIAAYNGIETLTPGQQVIIPRVPLIHGGIQASGYQTIPVLYYPWLSTDPSNAKAVSASNFNQQMQYLNENGYATISLDQFHAFLSLKEQLPPNAILITFDTTHQWIYEIALPILRYRNMKAALFIRVDEVGAKGRLTWAQLAEMAASGVDIGIQGPKTSPPDREDLKTYFEAYEKELTAPKNAFLIHLKRPCRYFSYARGESDDFTIAMLKKHGYRLAFTRKRGSNPFFMDDYKLKRITVLSHFDMNRFSRNLVTFKPAELQ